MAGRLVLVQEIGVRIPVREPSKNRTQVRFFDGDQLSKPTVWFATIRTAGAICCQQTTWRGPDPQAKPDPAPPGNPEALQSREVRANPCPGTMKNSHLLVAVFHILDRDPPER